MDFVKALLKIFFSVLVLSSCVSQGRYRKDLKTAIAYGYYIGDQECKQKFIEYNKALFGDIVERPVDTSSFYDSQYDENHDGFLSPLEQYKMNPLTE